jgi:hypothetical protein
MASALVAWPSGKVCRVCVVRSNPAEVKGGCFKKLTAKSFEGLKLDSLNIEQLIKRVLKFMSFKFKGLRLDSLHQVHQHKLRQL